MFRLALCLCLSSWTLAAGVAEAAEPESSLRLAAPEADFRPALVDPRVFGLAIPPGPVRVPGSHPVATHDADGEAVIGKLFVKVGSSVVVLLPDGQLVAREPEQAIVTDRRFKPIKPELLVAALQDEFPGFRAKKTRHYVYIYNTSEQFALATSRILESMLRGMLAHAKTQQIDVHAPEVPLVVVMFRTKDEFQRFRRMPEGVIAYYHTLTNRVVLHEETDLTRVKRDLAVQQAISTIAHEGAHQILHNIGVQARLSLWPMWLSEGLAEYYAPTSFGRRLKWKGAGHINDLRMFELEVYLSGLTAASSRESLLQKTIQASRLTSIGYASAWSLTHYLAKSDRKAFNRYVKKISQLGPLQTLGPPTADGQVPSNLHHLVDHFGEDVSDLEQQVGDHLRKLPYRDPFAEWPHFVATWTVPAGNRADRDANLFHNRGLAQKWLAEMRQGVPSSLRTEIQADIHTFPNRLLAERFARQWLGGGR